VCVAHTVLYSCCTVVRCASHVVARQGPDVAGLAVCVAMFGYCNCLCWTGARVQGDGCNTLTRRPLVLAGAVRDEWRVKALGSTRKPVSKVSDCAGVAMMPLYQGFAAYPRQMFCVCVHSHWVLDQEGVSTELRLVLLVLSLCCSHACHPSFLQASCMPCRHSTQQFADALVVLSEGAAQFLRD
jgi:hypothetical protein